MTTGPVALAGRVALVTGAERGIGRAVAVGLARSIPELEQTASELDGFGGQAVVLPADLGDRSQLSMMIDQARADLGNVDILVNNAAVVAPLGQTNAVDMRMWAAAIEVNVVAPATLTALLLGGCKAGVGAGS